MANAIVADCATPPPDDPPCMAPSPERYGLALEAAWELDMISIMLLRELNRSDWEAHEPLKYRPFAARAKELTAVLIGALQDEVVKTAELRRSLRIVAD